MKKILTLVLALFATPALAQWQVPVNTIPVGRGAGVTGFATVGGSGGAGLKCLLDTIPPSFGSCGAGLGAALTRTNDTNVTATLGGSPNTALLNAASITLGWTGTLAAARGGTGFGSYTIGDLLAADSGTTLSRIAAVAAGQAFISDGTGTLPIWSGDWFFADKTNKRIVIRKDTNTFPVPSSTSGFVVFGPDPGEGRMDIGAIDGDAVLFCFRVNNTWASPQPVGDRQQICGWTGGSTETNGSTTIGQGGYMGAFSRGAWTASNHGWYWDVGVIPNGSAGAGLIKSARFSDAGGFAVNTADVFPALGTIDAGVGYTVNGAATSGNVLRGDGTKFTSALLAATDITHVGLINYKITGINFNSANTDNSFTLTAPAGTYSRYQILRVYISHCSASITTATFGVFSAAAGGGTAIVASGTAGTVSTASENTANNTQSALVAVGASNTSTSINFTPIFFRVQTPQGSAVTCDVTFQVEWIS